MVTESNFCFLLGEVNLKIVSDKRKPTELVIGRYILPQAPVQGKQSESEHEHTWSGTEL